MPSYEKPNQLQFTYGTAGFRMNADLLDSVLYRMGLLASLRSQHLEGQAIGVMLTASHNPEADNGVKLVDPMGEMLAQDWEPFATQLANASLSQVKSVLEKVKEAFGIKDGKRALVVVGRDTRPSGPRLIEALFAGLNEMGAEIRDFGIVTTPQLHYFVRCINTKGSYGEPTEQGYYQKLSQAYQTIVKGHPTLTELTVDCANGVGAPTLKSFLKGLSCISVVAVNDRVGEKGVLNYQCGADFVKVDQTFPKGLTDQQKVGRCASFDGDADRLVYYTTGSDGKFVLLDGDKIAALSAGYLKELLVQLPGFETTEVGVVQTAYANGSSTAYFTRLGIPVAFTETGVKHLHHRAEEFDVGVYFEANGHGTVLFNPKLLKKLDLVNTSSWTPPQLKALETFKAFWHLINQTVGDALSDLLMVEAILTRRQWTLDQWAQIYKDLPQRQLKVRVKDRLVIKTEDADRRVSQPAGFQAKVDALVKTVPHGRSFVRPSGTEDVVRIYAEAETQQLCDDLANKVAQLVFDHLGGIGDRPK